MKKLFAVMLSLLMIIPVTSLTIHANTLDNVTIESTEKYYNKNVDTSEDNDYSNRILEFVFDHPELSYSSLDFSVEVNGEEVPKNNNVWTTGYNGQTYVYFYPDFIETYSGDLNVTIKITRYGEEKVFDCVIYNEFYEITVDSEVPAGYDDLSDWMAFVDEIGDITCQPDTIFVPKGKSISLYGDEFTEELIPAGWYCEGEALSRTYDLDYVPDKDATLVLRYEEPKYEISVDKKIVDFGEVNPGYEVPDPIEVTITNTGNKSIRLYDYSVESEESANPKYYTIKGLSIYDVVAPGESVTIWIQPVSGLSIGTYDETIELYMIELQEMSPMSARAMPLAYGDEPTLADFTKGTLPLELSFSVVEKKEIYTLTFDTNGGNAVNAVSKEEGSTIDLEAYVPTKDGYVFEGWYADEELKTAVDEVLLEGNTTVYAKWQKVNETKTDDQADSTPNTATKDDLAFWMGMLGAEMLLLILLGSKSIRRRKEN